MRVFMLPSPEGHVIAREEQFGRFEGEFSIDSTGQVMYRHPWDSRQWWAGDNKESFRQAATAWNEYCIIAEDLHPNEEVSRILLGLREKLARAKVLIDRPDSLWSVLLEQAEHGLL